MATTNKCRIALAAVAAVCLRGVPAWAACNGGLPQPPGGCLTGFPLILSGANTASTLRGHPVIADLGLLAGHKQIVFATSGGRLWAVNDDGTIPAGFPITLPGSATVLGGPAVGDVDGDGKPDIVVAWGTLPQGANPAGGFGAFKNPGAGNAWSSTPLWQHATRDILPGPPDGVADGAVSTPAIGDVDGDGKNEVVVASLDERIYVVDGATGANKSGWPVWAGDTIYSSPALADLDGDGKLEIIVGVDAHFLVGGEPPGVIVPPSPNGGFLLVLNANGAMLPGFPVWHDQVIASAPVVGDIDGDGRPEIIFGTGSFFAVPQASHLVYAVHCDGSTVAGWPVSVDGQVMTAPALGDLDNDGIVDVVVTDDNTGPSHLFHVYAFKGTGAPVAGWTASGKVVRGTSGESLSAGDPVIADVLAGGPGSGKEVLVPQNSEIVIFDAAGAQLTKNGAVSGLFSLNAQGSVTGVAVDVSGAIVEVVTTSGSGTSTVVSAWKGTGSTTQVPWGMFHRDAAAAGRAPNAGICAPRVAVATSFFPLAPCRVLDTRDIVKPLGGPGLQPGVTRSFTVGGVGVCGIPANAVSISVNLTVTNVTAPGDLVVFPSDVARPATNAVSFKRMKTQANNGIAYLAAATPMFSVYNNSAGSVDLVLDVNGYFAP